MFVRHMLLGNFPAFGRGPSLRQQGREYRQGSERRFPRLRVTMLR